MIAITSRGKFLDEEEREEVAATTAKVKTPRFWQRRPEVGYPSVYFAMASFFVRGGYGR